MAKKPENMTQKELMAYHDKKRAKAAKERKKVAEQVPAHLSVQVEELVAIATEIACDALYNGGPRYISCDLFHQLEDQSEKVRSLYCFGR